MKIMIKIFIEKLVNNMDMAATYTVIFYQSFTPSKQ